MLNGKKPPLAEGMVLLMTDGSQRKILRYTPGASGEVICKTRTGGTGRWKAGETVIPRRAFWKGVESVRD